MRRKLRSQFVRGWLSVEVGSQKNLTSWNCNRENLNPFKGDALQYFISAGSIISFAGTQIFSIATSVTPQAM